MNWGGIGAVGFAVLLTVSMFAPAVSATQTNAYDEGTVAGSEGVDSQYTEPSLVNTTDKPPIVLKLRALERIQSLDNAESINETLFSTFSMATKPTHRVTKTSHWV